MQLNNPEIRKKPNTRSINRHKFKGIPDDKLDELAWVKNIASGVGFGGARWMLAYVYHVCLIVYVCLGVKRDEREKGRREGKQINQTKKKLGGKEWKDEEEKN
jgi:hypothetical protein